MLFPSHTLGRNQSGIFQRRVQQIPLNSQQNREIGKFLLYSENCAKISGGGGKIKCDNFFIHSLLCEFTFSIIISQKQKLYKEKSVYYSESDLLPSSGIYSIRSRGWQLNVRQILFRVLLSSPPDWFRRRVRVPCPISFSWRTR